jgi:hypothetical protein
MREVEEGRLIAVGAGRVAVVDVDLNYVVGRKGTLTVTEAGWYRCDLASLGETGR